MGSWQVILNRLWYVSTVENQPGYFILPDKNEAILGD